MKPLIWNEYEIQERYGSIVFINHAKEDLTLHLEDSFSPLSIVASIKKLKYLGVPEELVTEFINWTNEIREWRVMNEDMDKLEDYKWCRLARYACQTKNKDILTILSGVHDGNGRIDCKTVTEKLKTLGAEIPAYFHCSECPSLSFRAEVKSMGGHVL